MDLDQKAKESIKWMAIYGAAASGAEVITTYFAMMFLSGLSSFGFGGFPGGQVVNQVIWGAVTGAIFGFILSKYYPSIMEFNRKYLGNFFGSLFKLLFYPYLIAGAISLFAGAGAAAVGFGIGPLAAFAGVFVIRYVYAKMVVGKLGQYYQ
jgi:Na+/H+-dicarboxylate symporter